MVLPTLSGLDLLATAVMLLDHDLRVCYANPAAENLFQLSSRHLPASPITEVFDGAQVLASTARAALARGATFTEYDIALALKQGPALPSISPPAATTLRLDCACTPVSFGEAAVLVELRLLNQQLKAVREERALQESQHNRELVRNLAHEIRNPLGGIRGAAQLLENELERKELTEYTRVIIKEADRLQALLDRLLTPSRIPRSEALNVHEVLEQVRSLILAEFPKGLRILRDYDPSLPDVRADKQQMTQTFLNIVRNAAQALSTGSEARRDDHARACSEIVARKDDEIVLRTRAARRVTLAKKSHRLALCVQVIDNGPGIAHELQEKIFYPLFSAREGGTGLGLTIAQSFVSQQGGTIEVESVPGRTCFMVMLPVHDSKIE